jgi:prevent-host-death family protein
MDKLSVFEAKARFSEVVNRAEQGRQTVITKRGKAVARVVPEGKQAER